MFTCTAKYLLDNLKPMVPFIGGKHPAVGLNIRGENGKVILVATDGLILQERILNVTADSDFEFVISKNAVDDLIITLKTIPKEAYVTISDAGNCLLFRKDSNWLGDAGKQPNWSIDYKRVIAEAENAEPSANSMICVNPVYFTKVLKVFGTEKILIKGGLEATPKVLRNATGDVTCLIMPCTINLNKESSENEI